MNKNARYLAAAITLAAVMVTAACSGDVDDDTATDSNSTTATSGYENVDIVPTPGSENYLSCGRWTNDEVEWAEWDKGDKYAPPGVLVLSQAYDLPSQFAPLADRSDGFGRYVTATFRTDGGLTQYQDRSIGVLMGTSRSSKRLEGNDATMDLAVLDQDGSLVSHHTYTEGEREEIPRPFDLVRDMTSGYYRVEAQEGIEIPAAAGGDKENKEFVLAALPDAFDETSVWVLLRGDDRLYKAKLFYISVEFPSILPYLDKCDA